MNPSTVDDTFVPDLEDLAAYLDDMLPAERRSAVEARLAEDPEYYEVFLDTVRFREEAGLDGVEEVGKAPQPLLQAGPSQPTLQRGSIPLALAAGLLLALLWRPWESALEKRLPGDFGSSEIARLDEHSRGWRVTRGGPEEGTDAEDRGVAFRTGAYLLHLELAAEYQDGKTAVRALRDIERELNRRTWPPPRPVISKIKELHGLLKPEDVKWRQVSSDTRALKRSLESDMERGASEGDALKWGRWSEHVLLLYLEERQPLLDAFLDSPPRGFDGIEEVPEALQGMRQAPKSLPNAEFEVTPFLEAHGDLEEALGN